MYHHKNGLCFRKAERYDLEELLEFKSTAWATNHGTAFLNMEDQERWFDSLDDRNMVFICMRDKNSVGLLILSHIDPLARMASIGGGIFAKYRGLSPESDGTGTSLTKKVWCAGVDFSFEMLNLRRLDAEVVEYNLAVVRFDLALGFRHEGTRRKSVYKCGKYYDSHLFGLLREEWEQTDRVRQMGGICNTDFRHRNPRVSSKVLDRLKKSTEECLARDDVMTNPVDDWVTPI